MFSVPLKYAESVYVCPDVTLTLCDSVRAAEPAVILQEYAPVCRRLESFVRFPESLRVHDEGQVDSSKP